METFFEIYINVMIAVFGFAVLVMGGVALGVLGILYAIIGLIRLIKREYDKNNKDSGDEI